MLIEGGLPEIDLVTFVALEECYAQRGNRPLNLFLPYMVSVDVASIPLRGFEACRADAAAIFRLRVAHFILLTECVSKGISQTLEGMGWSSGGYEMGEGRLI